MTRRWNGWGSDADDAPLSQHALRFVVERITDALQRQR